MRMLLITACLTLISGCTCQQDSSVGPPRGAPRMAKGKAKGKMQNRGKMKRKGGKAVERTDVTIFLLDQKKVDAGDEDPWVAVSRKVGAKVPAKNAVWVLFKGPTAEEAGDGLTLLKSGSEGFQGFKIENKVATLQLRGGCNNEGGALTVFDHLEKTLKAFPEIDHVKLLDPDGNTQNAEAEGDSKPACLEP